MLAGPDGVAARLFTMAGPDGLAVRLFTMVT
jgi:hypothetical protein